MARRPGPASLLWVAAALTLTAAAFLLLAPEGDSSAAARTGQTSSETSETPPSTGEPTTPSSSTSAPTAPPAEEEAQEDLHAHEDVASSFSPPQWSPEAASAAENAAEAVLAAWLSGEPYDQWWAHLEPLMNVTAGQIYESVDPAEIAPATIQGAAIAQETTTGYLVEVAVPTTQGEYVVVLTRDAEGDPWLAERLRIPSTETPT